ncbi:MAG: NADPH-dependent assimilatory sulfite reductase hemoprotein subunit, partial [Candidatus Omnitrophica bacterium]|nr:NADPH-dependent assimilatory sulfite reductase hemoprotein subunit [Candidatus Omnitrophota bacterium]
ESLADEITGSLYPDDLQLIKFHGTYMQWDRPSESERKKQKLEPLYSFMIRVRVPGGVVTPAQWLGLERLSDQYGSKTLKLTTRQTVELHSILKRHLKTAIKGINDLGLTTVAACGDVNRNVMAGANVQASRVHAEIEEAAKKINAHLLPRTSAYRELWLDGKAAAEDQEPIYGPTYLPRKFKITIAVPPVNDTDVFAHDIGLIAVVDKGVLLGFNVSAGGGMGSTFGMPETFPRLGNVLGFVPKDNVIAVCETILLIQKDNGNRSNRKLSRLKYTVEKMTVPGFKAELEKRLGFALEPARPYQFTTSNDRYGWQKGEDGQWSVTLFIEGGRVKDVEGYPMKTGLSQIARIHRGTFILTGNQNLVIAGVEESARPAVQALLDQHGISAHQQVTGARGNSLACVAMPVCPLAFADAETYLPSFMDKLDAILLELGLKDVPVNVRMTGCPNGCARPALGEIAMIGRGPGKYNLYLGASHNGERMNTLFKETIGEAEILSLLKDLLTKYAANRQPSESFGDFVNRAAPRTI